MTTIAVDYDTFIAWFPYFDGKIVSEKERSNRVIPLSNLIVGLMSMTQTSRHTYSDAK